MKRFLTLLLMLLLFSVPAAAQAAGVPVYLEGERVATAVQRGGYTYLPLRTMFETLGADVKWNAAERKIEAIMPLDILKLRVSLFMQVGSREAWAESGVFGGYCPYEMERAPYLSRGTVYVPLRFVAEDVLDFEVKWRNNAVYLTAPKLTYTEGANIYTLNLYNGEVRLAENGGLERSLGFCPAPGYGTYQPVYLTDNLKVMRTEAGNYILQADGMMHSEPSHIIRWVAWLREADGLSYANYNYYDNNMPEAAFGGGKVLLNVNPAREEAEQLIDEASGQLTELNFSALVAAALPEWENHSWIIRWTDGRYVLLTNLSAVLLYDLQSGEVKQITDRLLQNVREEALAFVLQAGADFELAAAEDKAETFWQRLGRDGLLWEFHYISMPRLTFAGAEGERLNFVLTCIYCDAASDERMVKEYPLSFSLAELLG